MFTMWFTPHKGICVNCEKEKTIVVKAGYCHYCNETVRKKKSGKQSLKKTPIRRGNKNSKANNDFYKRAWEYWKRNGMLRCMESEKPLGQYSPAKVAHILSRQSHPRIKYELENVIPLLPEYHDQLDSGDCTKMRIWPWIKEKRQELKQKYYSVNNAKQ